MSSRSNEALYIVFMLDTKFISDAVQKHRQKHHYTPKELKASFFDMDGVLFDSMPAHARSWVQAVAEEGLKTEPEDFYLYEGQTAACTINLLYRRHLNRDATKEEEKRIYLRKTALFGEYDSGRAIPDAESVVAELSDTFRVLVTGSSQPGLLERIGKVYPGIFNKENMVTGNDVSIGKPHPEPYLMALKYAKASPEEALVVENAPKGVRAGVSAGIFTVAVNTGPLPDAVLYEEGAGVVFDDMSQLLAALPHIREAFAG
ncbi:HAD family hydrolase [Porphyromonas macacae]|nr:HAD-IA family hydrolase [Porphyromonas macacae]